MDRDFAEPLDLARLAAIACVAESTFIRGFKAAFGETPHRYLQRRRIERAMFMLRTTDTSVTDVCMSCGFSSLGTFSRTFTEIVGLSPSQFRSSEPAATPMVLSVAASAVPSCFVKQWTRPSSFGEAAIDEVAVR